MKLSPTTTSHREDVPSGAWYSDPGIGFPCGQVVGSSKSRRKAASTLGETTCSHFPASW